MTMQIEFTKYVHDDTGELTLQMTARDKDDKQYTEKWDATVLTKGFKNEHHAVNAEFKKFQSFLKEMGL